MRHSFAARWAAPVVIVLFGMTSTAFAAPERTSTGAGWSIDQTPNVGTRSDDLEAVSCPRANWCMAVGHVWFQGPIGELWDGTSWSLLRIPERSHPRVEDLAALSCVAPTACMAVGMAGPDSDGPWSPLSYRWNGSGWSPSFVPLPDSNEDAALNSVSCVAADACMAVGWVYQGRQYWPLAEWWNGSTWRIQSKVERASWAGSFLSGVSCTSSIACVAVGWNDRTAQPTAARWDGNSWSPTTTVTPSGMIGSEFHQVSCVGPSACVAVGSQQSQVGDSQPLIERWNGSTWTLESLPIRSSDRVTDLASLSCWDANDCVAVGTSFADRRFGHLLIVRWNRLRWAIESAPEPPGSRVTGLHGVSCSMGACTAVGSFNAGSGYQTLAERSGP